MSLQSQLINILIVSIPEQFFITLITLIMLGKYKFLAKEHWKTNLIKIMFISVIPMAILSNAIDYIGIKILIDLKIVIGFLVTGLTVVGLCNVENIKEFGKIMLFGLAGFIIFILLDLINAIVIMYGAKVPITEFNTSPFLNFIIGLPERVVEYSFLIYVFIKKNSLSQINFNKLIFQNRQLRNTLIVFSAISLLMLVLIIKYIFLSNILKPLPTESQLFITIMVLSSVIFIAIVPWLISMNIYSNEKYLQKYGKVVNYFEE